MRRILAPAPPGHSDDGPGVLPVVACVVAGGAAYGAVLGSYGGFAGARAWQLAYAALKVPLLVGATFGLGLPSFYVLNALLGLRRDFGRAARALARAQAVFALVLASLAPYTALVYASGLGYAEALLWNAGLFGVASAGAQLRARALYRPLVRRDPRHRLALRAWFATYAFVGIQMGWVLRPFLGAPDAPVRFLRPEAWGNAYMVVLRLVGQVIGG